MFNSFVLMVFCFHKKVCTVPEIYLSNLAAADLVLVATLPFWAVNVSSRYNWPFGTPLCKLVNINISMNMYCSIYFLVLISIDRFVALVHPLSQTKMRRPKYAKLCCVLVWCFGLLMNSPALMYRKVGHIPSINTTLCYFDFPNPFVDMLISGIQILFIFIIPVSIISPCSFKIIKALKTRENTQKKEMKATTLVLAVLLAFLVCWIPFNLIGIVKLIGKAGGIKQCSIAINIEISHQVFLYFALFNSVINPVLYVIVGKNFRKKVKELINQWSRGENTSINYTSSSV
ncbi:B2 bradykinin receptor-like [Halichoeres trimaculatus]|uniref:B2 bradykinin receptor-like n=1 Tax=Halichoeres trimaculatus TaxID=147232 RepID=UPI003D9F9EA9